MKLIVTIPAYNEAPTIANVIAEVPRHVLGIDRVEVLVVDDGSTDRTVEEALAAGADHVISLGRNMGLAAAFRAALKAAVARGADIIVNTDADNHYDQSRIPDLVRPLLEGQADIAVGSRDLAGVRMRPANRYGNRFANFVMQRLLGLPDLDVSTGFRAYTRDAALKLNVLSHHTYTHETLIHARDQRLAIENVALPARAVERPSRLISSLPRHVWRAGLVILNSFTLYRPLQVWGLLGIACSAIALLPFLRFLYFFAQGQGGGHVQSLVIGGALLFLGVQMFVAGLLASSVAVNRRLIEDVLYRIKDAEGRSLAEGNGWQSTNGNGHNVVSKAGGTRVA